MTRTTFFLCLSLYFCSCEEEEENVMIRDFTSIPTSAKVSFSNKEYIEEGDVLFSSFTTENAGYRLLQEYLVDSLSMDRIFLEFKIPSNATKGEVINTENGYGSDVYIKFTNTGEPDPNPTYSTNPIFVSSESIQVEYTINVNEISEKELSYTFSASLQANSSENTVSISGEINARRGF